MPVDRPPLRDGWITLQGDRILAVGNSPPVAPLVDVGESVILPGLVNAHTHLEFSQLAAPLGQPGQALPDWIRAVLAWRRSTALSKVAIAHGLAESAAGGATLLADIVQPGSRAAYHAPPQSLSVVALLELLGLGDERRRQLEALAAEHMSDLALAPGVLPGLSPHAPYSTHPDLLAAAVCLAGPAPVAMHLAESREELKLLATGGGPFRTLLEELGVGAPGVFGGGRRILDYLQVLGQAPRSLVIHGNYLSDDEVDFVARHSERMSVVYCPRTHAYFGHDSYPLARLLSAGATVAIGTDSRASNPDLSLLNELRALHRLHPQLAPATILELGTLAGARALGLADDHGSLTPGKLANLVIVTLSFDEKADPLGGLLAETRSPRATIARGQVCAGKL